MIKRVYIAGHKGMVGSSIYKKLKDIENIEILTAPKNNLNLLSQREVLDFFKNNKIDEVYLAAAKVGGIYANNEYPAEFIYENLMIQANVINSAFKSGVNKLLFLGSSCIYPKFSRQPIKEDDLLSGFLEPTNEPYAIAKIAGIKLCESFNRQYKTDYRSIMPTNLYGPGDNFHEHHSHVIPGLIKRIHDAKINNKKEIKIWGSGTPKREFLYVDDMAEAAIYVMNLKKETYWNNVENTCSHVNIGCGYDISIIDLAKIICDVIGFKGNLVLDKSKPDGTPKKLMDVSRLSNLGWESKTKLEVGLMKTYKWFINNHENIRLK